MNRGRAILAGGILTALLSNLPIIEYGNVACCMWLVAGGALAASLAGRSEEAPMGVAYSGLTGFLAGLVSVPFSMAFSLIFTDLEKLGEEMERSIAMFPPEMVSNMAAVINIMTSRPGAAIMSGFQMFIFGSIFCTAGGALAGYWKSGGAPNEAPGETPPEGPPARPPFEL